VGIQREHARVRRDPEHEIEHDRRLLLERARDHETGVEALYRVLQDLFGAEVLEVWGDLGRSHDRQSTKSASGFVPLSAGLPRA
jgi:hypothetical protein